MVGLPSSDHTQKNKHNSEAEVPTTRVDRLLRERELKRNNKATCHNNGVGGGSGGGGGRNGENFDIPYDEGTNESVTNVGSVGDGHNICNVGRLFRQRLLIVANRLPVSAVRRGEESWLLEISAGGLVSSLLGVRSFDARWIGWPGVNVPDELGQRTLAKSLIEKRCIPVFLDEEVVHQYYNGYCNNILWSLFHYLGLPQEDRLATTRTFQSQFDAYKRANRMFADVVSQSYQEGDVVWIHDYHLMFLPKYLKEHNKNMKVGWFLHTPFPSSEIHRTLPSRSELLSAILCADVVG